MPRDLDRDRQVDALSDRQRELAPHGAEAIARHRQLVAADGKREEHEAAGAVDVLGPVQVRVQLAQLRRSVRDDRSGRVAHLAADPSGRGLRRRTSRQQRGGQQDRRPCHPTHVIHPSKRERRRRAGAPRRRTARADTRRPGERRGIRRAGAARGARAGGWGPPRVRGGGQTSERRRGEQRQRRQDGDRRRLADQRLGVAGAAAADAVTRGCGAGVLRARGGPAMHRTGGGGAGRRAGVGLGGGGAVGVAVVAQAPGPRGRQRQAGGEHHGDEQAGQPACELHHVLYLTPKVSRR